MGEWARRVTYYYVIRGCTKHAAQPRASERFAWVCCSLCLNQTSTQRTQLCLTDCPGFSRPFCLTTFLRPIDEAQSLLPP